MGLAPYGKPIYSSLIKNNLDDIKEDGSFRLNQDYFENLVPEKLSSKMKFTTPPMASDP